MSLCECGCGRTPKGEKARFMPGHDGSLRRVLLKRAKAGVPEAQAELERRGWELKKPQPAESTSASG